MSNKNEHFVQSDSPETLLARIDERTQKMSEEIQEIKTNLNKKYVTQDEFKPVKAIAFTAVSLISIGVLGALLKIILS